MLFRSRTAWNELVTPRETAAEGEREAAAPLNGATAAPTTTSAPDSSPIAVESEAIAAEPTRRDALEARCAAVAAEAGLSPREAEVLVYLARGFTPAYIAKTLVLSISTVRTHVRNIYRKLGVGKREELIHLIDGE